MMSGTSFDGVDAAIVETDGQAEISFGLTGFEPYSDAEREVLRAAMGKWPGDDLGDAHRVVLNAHARLALRVDADVIGFHGQTLAHDPDGGRTHQLGDGAELARLTGRKVVWDFRSADMLSGGQGAPLAPFFHHALARNAGLEGPVAFLNLGGVANVTWVDPGIAAPEDTGALLAFDTGPANALLDDFLQDRLGLSYDAGGQIAAKGRVLADVMARAETLDYLALPAPKSLDRDAFAGMLAHLEDATTEDGAATLTALTAMCVGRAVALMPEPPLRWLACGGGRRNATMMEMISNAVQAEVASVESIGFDGDMLEAQAFGWLAARVLQGLPTSAASTTGTTTPVSGGRISAP